MPTGLYVIGSRAPAAGPDQAVERNLMTANLVVQVATEPKLVAVAVDAAAVTGRLVEAGGCFSVSILDRQDRAVVRRFVKPVTDVTVGPDGRATAMAGEAVVEAVTGAPILGRAAALVGLRGPAPAPARQPSAVRRRGRRRRADPTARCPTSSAWRTPG